MTIFKVANGGDPDEAAHNEPPHLDPHCLPSLSLNSQYGTIWMKYCVEGLQT